MCSRRFSLFLTTTKVQYKLTGTHSTYTKANFQRTVFNATTNLQSNAKISTSQQLSSSIVEDWIATEDCEVNIRDYVKDLIGSSAYDDFSHQILETTCIKELLNLYKDNKYNCGNRHIVRMLNKLNSFRKKFESFKLKTQGGLTTSDYAIHLNTYPMYKELLHNLRFISRDEHLFDIFLCLRELGESMEEGTPTNRVFERLKYSIEEGCSLSLLRKYLLGIQLESAGLRTLFLMRPIVPIVFNSIDTCKAEEFEDLCGCLKELGRFISFDTLKRYKNAIQRLINDGSLDSKQAQGILYALEVLIYPEWRVQNSPLISALISCLKNNIHLLNSNQLATLLNIYIKNPTPGDMLLELQRCANKYLIESDKVSSNNVMFLFGMSLFSRGCIRNRIEKYITTFTHNSYDLVELEMLAKLLVFNHSFDVNLYKNLWNRIDIVLKQNDKPEMNLISIAEQYVKCIFYCPNFKNNSIEEFLMKHFRNVLSSKRYDYFPKFLCTILSTLLACCNRNDVLIMRYIYELEANCQQISVTEYIKLAYVMKSAMASSRHDIRPINFERIETVLNKRVAKDINSLIDFYTLDAWLKVYLYLGWTEGPIVNQLLHTLANEKVVSTRQVVSLCQIFMQTNVLFPNIVDNMCDYVCSYKNVLASTVCPLLYLCYNLGYTPKNCQEFFNVSTNIIIRDQGKLNDMQQIKSAVSLGFFNRLPVSLIHSILSPQFVKQLTSEEFRLKSTNSHYFAVQRNLMEFNRLVCLSYPELDVPWIKHNDAKEKLSKIPQNFFHNDVWCYLSKSVKYKKSLEQHVFTPYNYHINFVVDLAKEGTGNEKVAILLNSFRFYTRFTTQLRGRFVLKKRHLEQLGYKVIMLKQADWICLFDANEKTDFIMQFLRTKNIKESDTLDYNIDVSNRFEMLPHFCNNNNKHPSILFE